MDCVGFETVASLHTFTKLFIGISKFEIMISKSLFMVQRLILKSFEVIMFNNSTPISTL